MSGVLAALAFLTRAPLPAPVQHADAVARGALWFPLVGAAVGAAVAATALALAGVLGPVGAGAVAVALGTLLTGALHVDALADTADALGARTREQALAAMRDHATGAYGTTAIVLTLLVKASALGQLAAAGAWAPVVAAAALARAAPLVLGTLLPYARAEAPGLGRSITDHLSRRRAAASCAIAVALAVVLLRADAAVAVAACIAAVAAVGLWCRSRLGGVTGDTLGASIELAETLALVAAAAAR